MTVVMNDNEKGLRMTLPFTTDDFSVGGDVFNFYLPADCEGDQIDMTFEDLYSKYGDETYDHVQEAGTSDSRYNYVMSQHNQAFGTDDNIYNNKAEAASDTKESERITNNSMIRTQVGIAGTEAFRFNNADVLSSESGVMTEYPFTKAHYASFQDKDGNTVNGEFEHATFDSASEDGETKDFYVFTTDQTKYNIAPTTATQHRFYAFYKMTVFVQVATYEPIANFEPIYTESFYEAADGTNQKGAFYGVKITAPEGITNGMASDVAIYKAISEKLGSTGAPASLDQILYLDLSELGGVYHLDNPTSDYASYAIADFNALKNIGNLGVWATVFTVLAMFFVLLICLAPLIAIILIVWLIARNRNQRLKLAEKAMENGQPIPQEALSVPTSTDEDIKNKGLRNIFLGLGLVACGYFIIGDLLQGIGVILFFYGLGQALIARSSNKKKEQEEVLNNEIDHVENGNK